MNISIVGTGYVGLVSGACFSELGHHVMCVDTDAEKIRKLKNIEMPIYEEGLEDMVRRNVEAGRLQFTRDIKEGVDFSEAIFVAVGTPPDYQGKANMSFVEQVGRQVAEHMTDYRLLIEKSTVPVNTCRYLQRTISKYLRSDLDFDVASNPEFLREGCAIGDAMQPDRIVVGVESERASALLREIYEPLIKKSGCPYLEMNIPSAELTKHASNSFLAMKISYINAVARVCEQVGANVEQVAEGMGLDARIGPRFLQAGVGYGGSCFPKDLAAFVHLCDDNGYDFRALKEVQRINQEQREFVMGKIRHELWVMQDKKVAILGLAFKPDTDDIREAPSLYFVEELSKAGAHLQVWDPVAEENFRALYPDLAYSQDPLEAAADADLVLVLTEWDAVVNLDLDKLKAAMKVPVMVDGRNVFDPDDMKARGFEYLSVGRP